MNTIDLTLYLVGWDEDEAQGSMPFDSFESAASYRDDNRDDSGSMNIYSVTSTINFDTMQLDEAGESSVSDV